MVSTYFSYFVLSGEFDHQMVGRNYGLPRVEGRSYEDGIIGGRAINNKECSILSDLLRVIITSNMTTPRGYTFVPSNPTSGALVGTSRSLSILIC